LINNKSTAFGQESVHPSSHLDFNSRNIAEFGAERRAVWNQNAPNTMPTNYHVFTDYPPNKVAINQNQTNSIDNNLNDPQFEKSKLK
jgi:hypothetical protein